MADLGRTKIAEDDLITLGRNLRRGVRKVIYEIRKIGPELGGEENSAVQNLSHIIEGNISWGREMRRRCRCRKTLAHRSLLWEPILRAVFGP